MSAFVFDPADCLDLDSSVTVILIAGRGKVGKDTLADHLARALGDEGHCTLRTAFANPLKEDCARMFGFTKAQLHGDLKETIDPRWGKTPRTLMQWHGQKMRDDVDPRYWITRFENDQREWCIQKAVSHMDLRARPIIIVSDGRYINECVPFFNHKNGIVLHIVRPDAPPIVGGIPNHSSEGELDNPEAAPFISAKILNSRTKDQFLLSGLRIVQDFLLNRRSPE